MKPFIIAEVGINHNGDVEKAKQLINMAIRCGADAVKFQKRTVDKVYSPEELARPKESPWGTTYGEYAKGRELSFEDYDVIDKYCKDLGIYWFASAWDIDSQIFLRGYNLRYNKIASKVLSNKELVIEVAKERKHTFISTGLNDTDLIDWAVKLFRRWECPLTLMHCIIKYPCPLEECNLSRIKHLISKYNCPVGYSSHNSGILDKSMAIVLGAEAIEAHITLDRTDFGTDQAASLEERGLQLVVRDCNNVSKML